MIYIEKELDDLKKEVLEMWDLVNSQLNRAGEALLSMDKELAHEVTYREKKSERIRAENRQRLRRHHRIIQPRSFGFALYIVHDEDKQ